MYEALVRYVHSSGIIVPLLAVLMVHGVGFR